MNTDAAQRRERQYQLLRWGPFVFIGLLCVALIWIDGRLKRSESLGFVLGTEEWRVVAADLPGLWTNLEGLAVYEALQEHAPRAIHESSVEFRKLAGVRPTPARLRSWLGEHAVVSGKGTDWCVSFRPGVAMRIASAVHGFVAESSLPSVHSWGDLFYSWRDGFLLVAPTYDYLAQVAQTGTLLSTDTVPVEALEMSWEGEQAGVLQIAIQESLPFTLTLSGVAEDSVGAVRYSNGWPGAMAIVNGSDRSATLTFVAAAERLAASALPPATCEVLSKIAAAWWSAEMPSLPPNDWGGEIAWVVFPPENPNGKGAIRFGEKKYECDVHYMISLEELDNARAYRWDDQEGWLISSPQYGASWSVLNTREGLIRANNSELVPLLADESPGESVPGSIYTRIRWKPALRLGQNLLLDLASQSLIPGYNADDIRENWRPYLKALSDWESLEFVGAYRDTELHLKGHLSKPGFG